MYHISAKPARPRSNRSRNASLQACFLHMRRLRRACRPLTPLVLRALIVLFIAIQLRPIGASANASPVLPACSRVSVFVGVLSAMLSVIFFDMRVFSVALLACVFANFVFEVRQHEHVSLCKLLATLSCHACAILFSSLVGRRRSISKPSALRANLAIKQQYLMNLRCLRHVDVLEVSVRLQACLLTVDFCLAQPNSSSILLLTLPFVILFLLGYCTRRSGSVVVCLLCVFAASEQHSTVLGFSLVSTLSTVAAAVLALCVGPGVLTVDEWLATTQQLYY